MKKFLITINETVKSCKTDKNKKIIINDFNLANDTIMHFCEIDELVKINENYQFLEFVINKLNEIFSNNNNNDKPYIDIDKIQIDVECEKLIWNFYTTNTNKSILSTANQTYINNFLNNNDISLFFFNYEIMIEEIKTSKINYYSLRKKLKPKYYFVEMVSGLINIASHNLVTLIEVFNEDELIDSIKTKFLRETNFKVKEVLNIDNNLVLSDGSISKYIFRIKEIDKAKIIESSKLDLIINQFKN